jgi:hypothetical protein
MFIFLEVCHTTVPENNGNTVDMWNTAEILPDLADQWLLHRRFGR